MAGAELVFEIFARDRNASRTFRDIGKAVANTSKHADHLSKVTKNLGDSFGKLQAGGKFAVIGGAATTAIPHVLALTATLANVAPAAYAIVPAAVAGGAALATLKLATHGVSDALSAKNGKEFNDALKLLAPNARAFAVEMRRLYPTFTNLRKAVQNTAFQGLAAQLKPLAANLLPTVRLGLLGVAAAGNTAATKLAAFFRTGQAKSLLGTVLDGIVASFKGMAGIPAKLGKSLLQIAAAATPAFQRLAGAMEGVITKFTNWANEQSTNGQMQSMIGQAVDLLGQLGRIAGNVGSVIGGIFAAGAGGGLLDSIERITKAIADAVNSKKGQEVLTKVFEMMAKVGPAVAVAGALAVAIGGIAAAIGAIVETKGLALLPAALIGIAGGFAYVYTKSAGLREIVGMVGTKLHELWDLFVAKGLPVLKDFAQNGLAVAITGFNAIRDAIMRNKPELEQIWGAFKSFAGFMMSDVWPVIGLVVVGAFQRIFTIATLVVDVVGALVRGFNFMKGAVSAAVNAAGWVLTAFQTHAGVVVDGVIGFFKALPGRIRSAIGDLGSLLANAGRNLIGGLIGGVQSKIGELKGTLSGITNMIPDWKGPMTVDQRLLIPTGQAIMGGLMAGIGSQVVPLQRQLAGVTMGISTEGTATGGATVLPAPARAGGGGGGTVINNYLTINAPNANASEVVQQIRKIVRIEGGGNVQTAFGR